MNRDELRVAVKKAFEKSNNVAIQAATGSGKSKIALDLMYTIAERTIRIPKILIIVSEIAHINNWNAEIIKWNFNCGETTIICYASLKKYQFEHWDAIIFDEAHHLQSELRLEIFKTLITPYRIFLSATLKDSLIWKLEQYCGHIESVKFRLQDAFESNVLPEPKIKLISLTLSNKPNSAFIFEEWGNKKFRDKIFCTYKDIWNYKNNKAKYPNVSLYISCTQQQKYEYLTKQSEYYKKRYLSCRNEILKNKWMQSALNRKKYLGSIKTTAAIDLINKIKDKRFICFCTSIEQANELSHTTAVHSKNKNNINLINDFNNKKISNLFAVGMLQEGINLNDIEAGIIIQLDGEERAFIQRFGRVLRSDSPEQYIIYFKNTRDEEYLNNALENIDKNYITTYEIYDR